ncbi:MAG TPA: hypothetical protein VFZ04_17365, partial [Longimicrobiales bacterium]
MVFSGKVVGYGRGLGFGLVLALGIGLGGCEDSASPQDQPIRLSATMKLAADSLTVTLRVTNISDTTQVLEWGGCPGDHPADFAIYRDAAMTQLVWKTPGVVVCGSPLEEMELAPNESGTIRGIPAPVSHILGGAPEPGRFYVAAHP